MHFGRHYAPLNECEEIRTLRFWNQGFRPIVGINLAIGVLLIGMCAYDGQLVCAPTIVNWYGYIRWSIGMCACDGVLLNGMRAYDIGLSPVLDGSTREGALVRYCSTKFALFAISLERAAAVAKVVNLSSGPSELAEPQENVVLDGPGSDVLRRLSDVQPITTHALDELYA